MALNLFPNEMLKSSDMTLEGIASKLTYFHEQLHLIHWQTSIYAEHMATGSLYDYVHDFKDSIIEKLMGYMGRKPGVFKIEALTSTGSQAVAVDMTNFANELKRFAESNSFLDIGNLADEFSGEVAKFKYLLTLS